MRRTPSGGIMQGVDPLKKRELVRRNVYVGGTE
jgi:hypothetical protein